jgi:hypothetical protein
MADSMNSPSTVSPLSSSSTPGSSSSSASPLSSSSTPGSSSSASPGSSTSPKVDSKLFETGTITWRKENGKIILNMGKQATNDIIYETGMGNDVKTMIVEQLKKQQVIVKKEEIKAKNGRGGGTRTKRRRHQNRHNKTKRYR